MTKHNDRLAEANQYPRFITRQETETAEAQHTLRFVSYFTALTQKFNANRLIILRK